MIYLDTSCLLKLMLEEPESEAVRLAVDREAEVIVSALAELETAVQLRAGWLAGDSCSFPPERRHPMISRPAGFCNAWGSTQTRDSTR